jgi:transposase
MVAKKKRTRTRYSPEFKMETVRLLRSGRKQSELARELGINESMIREWSKQVEMREGMAPEDVFPGNGKQTRQDEEIRQLKREVERLKQERDFLKKAAAYFAKHDPE